MITTLCGGVGGSRFMRALAAVTPHERLTAIVNTGDDDEFHGLYVSPDPDIVTYALAGVVDDERGWGFRDETFRWIDSLQRFGAETWFRIGDRDLATHIHRTNLLREGATLSQAIARIATSFGVDVRLLPMSDDAVRTRVRTDAGEFSFQEFLVKNHAQGPVRDVVFGGVDDSVPAPGVIEAIATADAIFLAPSNPIGSISPILAVPGVRDAIASAHAARIAISPIIDGGSLQPPAGEMMSGLGYPVSVEGVARIYRGLIDVLIIDESDAAGAKAIEALGIRAVAAPILMRDAESSAALARFALGVAGLSP